MEEYMEKDLSNKTCRFCYKEFEPKTKQQRYCGLPCAYKGKNKASYREYISKKDNDEVKTQSDYATARQWLREPGLYGLCLEKERYYE